MSWILIAQRIFLDFVLHIIYLPVWWYTAGTKKVLFGCLDMIAQVNRQFAPGLWVKNLFVPMFGQRDFQGRITSFFIRFFNIIFRSIFVGIWSVIVFFLLFLWMAVPCIIVYMLVLSVRAQFFL